MGEAVMGQAVAGILDERRGWPVGDPTLMAHAVLNHVVGLCDSLGVEPIGSLQVDVLTDLLTGERAVRWELWGRDG